MITTCASIFLSFALMVIFGDRGGFIASTRLKIDKQRTE
jgi:hypothetical protein